MRAVVRPSISLSSNVAIPSPSANQLLIRVMACGINPVDYKLPKAIGGLVVGVDVAGVVEAMGEDVTGFSKGDEVMGFAAFGSGGVAEYALADAKKVCRKPASLSWAAAGAFATTWLTGYQSLVEHGKMEPGARVMIIGASGGCGTAGVQLAKALGAAEVVAVCSAANLDLVRGLGATRVVDYRDGAAYGALKAEGGQFDVIYDCATGSGGGENYSGDVKAMLKPAGIVVAINGGLGAWLKLLLAPAWLQSKHSKMMMTRQNGEQLEAILRLLGEGAKDAVIIDSVHALTAEGVDAAFSRLKSRRAKGKVVVDVAAVCSI